MNTEQIRCINDIKLYNKLIEEPDVVKVNELIERHEAQSVNSVRRQLLSTSVRLSHTMAPEITKMADSCIEMLDVKLPVELYVYSSPQFNAACFKPENERLYVMFSSSLLEGFTSQELRFVMGHELGHHVYNHHAVPIGYLLQGKRRPDPELALNLFAWSRYAEISADRAGAHCAQNMDAVARALFKLSSGLTSKMVEFSLDDFLTQVDDMQVQDDEPGKGAPQADWFSTHPFSPLRVRALKLFEQSEIYIGNKTKTDLSSKEEMEVKVQSVLSLMEPSYLEAKTDTAEAMRRLLFSGLIQVADASDGIDKKEIELFEQFFGKHAFGDSLNVEKIKHALSRRISEVKKKASQTQCMQVVRDLCLMAKADELVSDDERRVIIDIAGQLDVAESFVEQTLSMSLALD